MGETFNFYHIHKKGLGCIIADQNKGQALGKFCKLFLMVLSFLILIKSF